MAAMRREALGSSLTSEASGGGADFLAVDLSVTRHSDIKCLIVGAPNRGC
jgi:hypothetical protein